MSYKTALEQKYLGQIQKLVQLCIGELTDVEAALDRQKVVVHYEARWHTTCGKSKAKHELVKLDRQAFIKVLSVQLSALNKANMERGPVRKQALQYMGFLEDTGMKGRWRTRQCTVLLSSKGVVTVRVRGHWRSMVVALGPDNYSMGHLVSLLNGLRIERLTPYKKRSFTLFNLTKKKKDEPKKPAPPTEREQVAEIIRQY